MGPYRHELRARRDGQEPALRHHQPQDVGQQHPSLATQQAGGRIEAMNRSNAVFAASLAPD